MVGHRHDHKLGVGQRGEGPLPPTPPAGMIQPAVHHQDRQVGGYRRGQSILAAGNAKTFTAGLIGRCDIQGRGELRRSRALQILPGLHNVVGMAAVIALHNRVGDEVHDLQLLERLVVGQGGPDLADLCATRQIGDRRQFAADRVRQ